MGRRRADGRPRSELLATLEAIEAFIDDNGYPPTSVELAEIMEVVPCTARKRIQTLEEMGYLHVIPNKARGILLTDKKPKRKGRSRTLAVLTPIPLVDENGKETNTCVFAGDFAWQRNAEYLSVIVCDDAMTGDGIRKGDIVVARKQILPQNNRIVVAKVDGKILVRFLRIRSTCARLEASNETFKPILVNSNTDFRILGTVVAVAKTTDSEQEGE